MRPKIEKSSAVHTSKSKVIAGDNYGSGVRNPMGKIRKSYMNDGIASDKPTGRSKPNPKHPGRTIV